MDESLDSNQGSTTKSFKDYFLFDTSTISLLVSNLIVLVLALIQGWDLTTLLIVYWFQSVIIGFFNFFRILALKNFSTENFTINDRQVQPTQGTKIFTAFFFAFHYGFFHFVYFIFISANLAANLLANQARIDGLYILSGIVIFGVNHFFSFRHNKLVDEQQKQNIGSLMFMPYIRIIPMHIIMIFGTVLGAGSLFIFLVLKTIADMVMHTVKHRANKTEKPISPQSP